MKDGEDNDILLALMMEDRHHLPSDNGQTEKGKKIDVPFEKVCNVYPLNLMSKGIVTSTFTHCGKQKILDFDNILDKV
jgi:hypothetical protein